MSRKILRVWLTIWMLAVPLVHVHPEADHRHGALDHVHGGTVHSVFSSDLPCEFIAYDHASLASGEAHCPLHLIAQPVHAFEHLEIDFVLASSTPTQAGKAVISDALVGSNESGPSRSPRSLAQAAPFAVPTFLVLAASLSSRAPPFTV